MPISSYTMVYPLLLFFSALHTDQAMQVTKGSSKKPAAAPLANKTAKPTKAAKNPLFEKRPRNFGIGNDIQPKRDLSRFVKWPEYVRLQRQKAILKMRLKVPPAINQFTKTTDKNTGIASYKLCRQKHRETELAL